MKEYYSIIKIDESLDEQIEIPKKVLESEVYKVAIDILHEGEYWLHTHRKKTLDDSMELIEQYANNPAPVVNKGKCCDSCNTKVVIPTRINLMLGYQK